MKQLTVIVFEILFFVVSANAQHVLFVPTIEKTVAGNQYGAQLLFETKGEWSFGGFYQASLQNNSEGTQTSNPFYGIAVNAPLIKSDRIGFLFNARGGVVNQHFVVVTPGLETRLKISNVMSIATLMSIRMTYPSASLKIYFTI